MEGVLSGSSVIETEFFFHAGFANNENGNKLKAGPQAGPIWVVSQGRSTTPDLSIASFTRFQSPPIFRLTHREGFTDESKRKPAAARGAAIQGAT